MNLKPVLVDDLGSGFRGGLATDPGPPPCWRWALQPGRNQAWFGPPVFYLILSILFNRASQVAQVVKNLSANAGDTGLIPV